MTSKEEILDFLNEIKPEFYLKYNLVKLGLFGSFARDEGTAESDIDLIIEFLPNTEDLFEKKNNIKSIVKNRFNRNVDLCREKYLKSYFKSQVLQSVIYV